MSHETSWSLQTVRVARLLLVVLSIVVALGLGESAARIRTRARPDAGLRRLHVLRLDRPWLYGLRPGAEERFGWERQVLYSINEDGFRGPRYARPKPLGRFRVIMLGDSVTLGYGVEEYESIPRVLEAELERRAPEARIEVVNLGVGGYNAWNEAKLMADVGVEYQPDLVLVQFCINDLSDPTTHFDGQTQLALSAIPDAAFPDSSHRHDPPAAPSGWQALCARSSLCGLGQEAWRRWFEPELDDTTKSGALEVVESTDGPEWRWLEQNYTEIETAAKNVGAHFAILLVPYPRQLGMRERDPVREQMLALGGRHGWTVVDAVPAFRAARGNPGSLFIDQWHPTPEGHRLIAAETIRTLACSGDFGPAVHGACSTERD